MSIELRVEALERSARRWRVAAAVLAAALVAVLSVGAQEKKEPDAVTARSFTVVNARGEAVGVLSAEDDGGKLTLRSKEGGPVAWLAATPKVASLKVYDGERMGADVSARSSEMGGSAGVSVRDLQRDGASAAMTAIAFFGARVEVTAKDKSSASLTLSPDDAVGVSVKGPDGEVRWSEPRRK